MAQLVLGAVGAAVGFYVGGPTGAQIGWAVGSAVGSTFTPNQKNLGPRLNDMKVAGVEYGAPIPWLRGVVRVPGLVWWASEKHETATTTEVGKGGGGGVENTTFTYDIDLIVGLCDHEIACVPRIWLNGKLVYNVRDDADADTITASIDSPHWTRIAAYKGESNQLPDAVYEAAVGAANAPAYRGRAYVFIEGLKLGSSGQLPVLSFEVVVAGGVGIPKTLIQSYFETLPPKVNVWDNIACHPATASGATDNVEADVGYVLNSFADDDELLQYDGIQLNGVDGVTFEGFLTVFSNPNNDYTRAIRLEVYGDGGTASYVAFGIYGLAGNIIADSWDFGNDYQGAAWGYGERKHWAIQIADGAIYWHVDGVQVFARSGSVPLAGGHVRAILGGRGYYPLTPAAHYVIDSFRVRHEVVYGNGNFTPPVRLPPPDCDQCSYTLPTIRQVVEALCERAGLDPAQVDASALDAITQPVRSIAVANVMAQRGVLETLATSHVFECALSDKLYFFPRATAPVESIPFDTLGAALDAASLNPFAPRIGSDVEIPAQVCVKFINWNNDHQAGAEYSDRVIAGQAATNVVELSVGLTPAEAKGTADIIVMDGVASAVTVQVALPLDYAELEPGDVVTIYDTDTRPWRLRFVRRKDAGGVLTFDAVSDDQGVLLSSQVTDETDVDQEVIGSASYTVIEPLDVPLLRDQDDGVHYLVAARGVTDNWPGAAVMRSADDAIFATVATVTEAAVLGTCTTTLGAWDGGVVMDEINSVTVNVAHGQLSSATRDAVLEDLTINAVAIGSELVRFCAAELLSSAPNVYKLTRLLRGQRGTEWRTDTHAAGEPFVLLRVNGGLRRVASDVASFNLMRYLKGVTFGTAAADAQSEAFVHTGISSQPLAPVDVRAEEVGGSIVLTWKRRTRYSSAFVGAAGSIVPLGEVTEAYVVQVVLVSSGAILRTINATTSTATYTAAQQASDGVGVGAAIRFDVRQVSDTYGPGRAASMSMSGAIDPQPQITELTVGGSFVAGAELYATLGGVTYSYTSVGGDVDLDGIAASFAAVIDAASSYGAVAVGAQIEVTGVVSVPYTAIVGVRAGDNILTWTLTQTASAAVDGVSNEIYFGWRNMNAGGEGAYPWGMRFNLLVQRIAPPLNLFYSFTNAEAGGFTDYRILPNIPGAIRAKFIDSGDNVTYGLDILPNDLPNGFSSFITPAHEPYNWTLQVSTDYPQVVGLAANSARGVEPSTLRPQIVRVTLAGTPVTGYVYRATLGGVNLDYTATGGDTTAAHIATGLAAVIDAHADYQASAAGSDVTITQANDNVPFSFMGTVIGSTVTLSATTVQEAS